MEAGGKWRLCFLKGVDTLFALSPGTVATCLVLLISPPWLLQHTSPCLRQALTSAPPAPAPLCDKVESPVYLGKGQGWLKSPLPASWAPCLPLAKLEASIAPGDDNLTQNCGFSLSKPWPHLSTWQQLLASQEKSWLMVTLDPALMLNLHWA